MTGYGENFISVLQLGGVTWNTKVIWVTISQGQMGLLDIRNKCKKLDDSVCKVKSIGYEIKSPYNLVSSYFVLAK